MPVTCLALAVGGNAPNLHLDLIERLEGVFALPDCPETNIRRGGEALLARSGMVSETGTALDGLYLVCSKPVLPALDSVAYFIELAADRGSVQTGARFFYGMYEGMNITGAISVELGPYHYMNMLGALSCVPEFRPQEQLYAS